MNSNELEELEKRSGVICRDLFWISAKNRGTGATETLGLWNGDDVQMFTIGGQARTYFGPSIVQREPVRGGAGIDVRFISVTLAAILPEVELLLRTYEPRLAPVELHTAIFSAETRALIDTRRVFKGWVDQATITTGAEGGEAHAELQLASAARALTIPIPLMRSNAAQQARASGDLFRRWAAVAAREVVVGEEREA